MEQAHLGTVAELPVLSLSRDRFENADLDQLLDEPMRCRIGCADGRIRVVTTPAGGATDPPTG